jgi:hypothetical protein
MMMMQSHAYFSATMTDFDALPGVYKALFLYVEPGIYL